MIVGARRRPGAIGRHRGAHRCAIREFSRETKTATEREFVKRLLEQVGNIGADPGLGDRRGVLHHAAGDGEHHGAVGQRTHQRNRRTEDPGIQRRNTILCWCLLESLFLTLMGGLVGLALAWLLASGVGAVIKDYFPSFGIGASTFMVGISLMLAFGLITGAWPALTAMRLKIVDALQA